ncbi:unnamed protein product [Absidia cylindrospora]
MIPLSIYILLAASAVLIIGVIIFIKYDTAKANLSNSSSSRLSRPLPHLPLPLQDRTHSTVELLPTNLNNQSHRSSPSPPSRPISHRTLPSFRSDYVSIPPPTYDEHKNDTLLPSTN